MKSAGRLRRTSCSILAFLLAWSSVLPGLSQANVGAIGSVKVSPGAGTAAAVGAVQLSVPNGSAAGMTLHAPDLGTGLPPASVGAGLVVAPAQGPTGAAIMAPAGAALPGRDAGVPIAREAGVSRRAAATVAAALPAASAVSGRHAPAVLPGARRKRRPSGAISVLGRMSRAGIAGPLWDNSRIRTPAGAVVRTDVSGAGARSWFSPPGGWRNSADSFRKRLFGAASASDIEADVESFDWRPRSEESHRGVALIPRRTWLRWLRDKTSYGASYLSSFRWRITTRTIGQWDKYRVDLKRHGGPHAVRHRLAFYLQHLVMGSTGRFGLFGLRVTSNRIVVRDAWTLFNRFFPEDARSTEAFSRLVARAHYYNPNRRATQFRKLLQTALRDASILRVKELPAFFDSLAGHEAGAKLLEYQAHRQTHTLGVFDIMVRRTILEMNRELPPGARVVGVLLMGSFVNGAAGPNSDLDLQVITEGGSVLFLPDFIARLKARWKAAGMTHPIGSFQYALPVSKGLITNMHREPYLIFSPYPDVIEALQRSRAEDSAHRPSRVRKLTGEIFHALYLTTLLVILSVYEAARFVSRKKS